jgi:hypothetical protein
MRMRRRFRWIRGERRSRRESRTMRVLKGTSEGERVEGGR